MAHPKHITPEEVVQTTLALLEAEGASALSLRTVAERLAIKAPSLYRYFADKLALEAAVVTEGSKALL